MKNWLLLTILVFVIATSCEKKACCANLEIELLGRFAHQMPDCNNSDESEINCTEWLEFVNDTKVDILYGGGDIVYRFGYERKENMLHLEGESTSSFRVSFEIVDAETLVRTDTNDIWKKVE